MPIKRKKKRSKPVVEIMKKLNDYDFLSDDEKIAWETMKLKMEGKLCVIEKICRPNYDREVCKSCYENFIRKGEK